jgi:hypothetical protein
VPYPGRLDVQQQVHPAGVVPVEADPQDLIARDAVDHPGRVGVNPRIFREGRWEREPDEPLLVGDLAHHVGHREHRGVLAGGRVDPADLTGQAFAVEDRAVRGDHERGWVIEVGGHGLCATIAPVRGGGSERSPHSSARTT